jgi:hypothetical protein
MCPTQTYTVTALTTDGCKFSGSIIFNSDGTVTEIQRDPINWWINGWGDDSYIDYEIPDSSYYVEWILCDGSVYTGENVMLQQINCGSDKPNLILKDAAGNVVYTENIALRVASTDQLGDKIMKIFPNPVENLLNIQLGEVGAGTAQFDIFDLNGKILQKHVLVNVKAGTQIGIDVSALGHGVYVGKIVSGNKIIATAKFTK